MCLNTDAQSFMRRLYTSVSCSVAFTFAIMVTIAPVASAEDAQPLFTPSFTATQVRNIQRLSVQLNDPEFSLPTIHVLNEDEIKPLPDDRVIKAIAEPDESNVELIWDTAGLPNTNYKIRYSATDKKGAVAFEDHLVTVANNIPLVTIEKSETGRMIKGSVSRSDAAFAITIDGTLLEDARPMIALTPGDDGMYLWSFKVPDSIRDGIRDVTVKAKPLAGEDARDSEPAIATITLTTPVVVPPKVIPVQQLPPLELAPTIGQFVAPAIQEGSVRTKTTLYGVPVTDLVQNSRDSANVTAISPGNDTSVLGVQRDAADDGAIVSASESGWKLFGISWYWIALVGGAIFAAYIAYARSKTREAMHSI